MYAGDSTGEELIGHRSGYSRKTRLDKASICHEAARETNKSGCTHLLVRGLQ